MTEIEIGQRIKERRNELNMTLEQLASALDFNKSTMQRYETGKIGKIKLPVIQAIATVLKVNPEWLVLKTDEKMNSFDNNPIPYNICLSQKEEKLVTKYRENPSMQKAVDTLLGIEE